MPPIGAICRFESWGTRGKNPFGVKMSFVAVKSDNWNIK
jgi:hypothetical protein